MTIAATQTEFSRCALATGWRAGACVCLTAISITVAAAQDTRRPQQNGSPDIFTSIGRWFEDAFNSIGRNLKSAKSGVDEFNREAGVAARTTVGAAKEAADAVVRLPATRVVKGHENCPLAPNGAPDCVAAANKLCTSRGFGFGKSVDTTAAEECPAAVLLGKRAAKPGECRTVTFVTSAVCQ